jgi:predicted O-linked N-acetylglucosamine transferase (SPINDLY family)
MMHQAETTQEAVLFEARQWAKEHAEGLARGQSPHEHSRDPNRKLRIGYVSADFREHAVARFIEPLLIHHDRERFEVVCYSNTSRPDETTSRFQTLADVWRDIADMDDAVATQVIQNDSIDMLVDLSGHTAGNRLLVFARQPAPIQISYLGFPATTGLSTIQYRLTDWFADPPGAERFYTERLIRVPGHAWSYHPSLAQPAAVDLPALTNGYITFAALHRPLKITSQIARAWARVLDAVPGSRLLVSAQRQTSDTAEPAESLERSGIDPRRLEVIGRTDHANYLRSYFHADIALDAFPYNGTTTTCDALWMGLPVMTLAGTSHVSRTGMSLLTSVEMQELVTSSLDQYVDRAIALANDWACLQHLRARVRHGVSASFISGSAAFCATVESTLNNLWRDHCIN